MEKMLGVFIPLIDAKWDSGVLNNEEKGTALFAVDPLRTCTFEVVCNMEVNLNAIIDKGCESCLLAKEHIYSILNTLYAIPAASATHLQIRLLKQDFNLVITPPCESSSDADKPWYCVSDLKTILKSIQNIVFYESVSSVFAVQTKQDELILLVRDINCTYIYKIHSTPEKNYTTLENVGMQSSQSKSNQTDL